MKGELDLLVKEGAHEKTQRTREHLVEFREISIPMSSGPTFACEGIRIVVPCPGRVRTGKVNRMWIY